ncbi:O-antigen ligase family protein [Phosphitispora sp. TUW77]|uniref:O-antigen ligase family protein n=1 Tax=Phosphitispora sp. TUW77 TaxID=3152361 RepID=UPI003AB4475A
MAHNTESRPLLLNLNLRVFAYAGLVLLLFYPPFLRGLFFTPELLATHLVTSVVFALCWYDKLLRRDVVFFKGTLDYLLIAFVATYVFSLFGAVNMRGAVGELLKVINYFMVYWIVVQIVRQEKDIKTLYRVVFLSAVGVAVIGLGAAAGIVKYPAAVVGSRIYSTLQYPNTTATFLALGTFLGFGLLNTARTTLVRAAYAAGNMLLIAVIVTSQSRGSWFLYPIVLILFFIGMPKNFRFYTAFSLAVCLGVGLQAARVIQPHLKELQGTGALRGPALKYLLAGIIIVILAHWLYDFIISWLERKQVQARTRKALGGGVIAYALIVLFVYVGYTAQAVPTVAAQFAPSDALKRAGSINNQAYSYLARIDMANTALRMALDYPVNGLGGAGWDALYHQYQPYLMFSSETHNYPAKVLVETGFIGLMVLLGIWFLWGQNLYRLWREDLDEQTWLLVWAGGAAAATLGIHSIFDFDLSMGAMGIVLWFLWGITRAAVKIYLSNKQDRQKAATTSRKMLFAAVGGFIAAGLLFIPAACFYTAGLRSAEAAQAMKQRNWVLAERKLLTATALDPFTASYAADLAHVYTIKGMAANDPEQISLAEKYSERAVSSEPYNYQVRLRLLTISLLSGRIESSVNDAESLVLHNPLDEHNFEILGKVYITAGHYLYQKGQKEKAELYWTKASGLRQQLEQKLQTLDQSKAPQKNRLELTSLVSLYEGEAAYLLGDYHRAAGILEEIDNSGAVLTRSLSGELAVYLNAARTKISPDKAEIYSEVLLKSYPELVLELQKILKIGS